MFRLLVLCLLLIVLFLSSQPASASELQVSVAYAYQRARTVADPPTVVTVAVSPAKAKNVLINGTWYTQQADGTLTVCRECNTAESCASGNCATTCANGQCSPPPSYSPAPVYRSSGVEFRASAGFCGSRAGSGGACGLLLLPIKIVTLPFRLLGGCR